MNEAKTPEERTAEANARKAEAEAKKAEMEANQAEAERAEWQSELAKQAREAAQRQAIAVADKTFREAGETLSDELVQQKLEADAKKAIAEANKAVGDAERAQVSAFIPDFSTIERGETTLKGDRATFGTLLGRMALTRAAEKVVNQLKLSDGERVLITMEADLASADAVYLEVITGLVTFTESANRLLGILQGKKAPAPTLALAAGSIVGAIASAAPGLLSLFSANRTLSSFASTADTKAAVAAVAAKLVTENAVVQIDDFRLTQAGRVVAKEKALREARSKLVEHKLKLEEDKMQAGRDKQSALDAIAEFRKQLAALEKDDPKGNDLMQTISEQQLALEMAKGDERTASVGLSLVSELVTGIDAFLTSLHTIPSGGKRSPFASAVLHQSLHGDGSGDGAFTKVLFIEASAGTVDQLVTDRPLWFKDKLHTIGSVAITYWLMDTATSNIVASGVASGVAEMRGKIGESLETMLT